MAHFAEIDGNNKVVRVVRVQNEVLDNNGTEDEGKGIRFLNQLLGPSTRIQTSYSGSFRKNFAGIGDTYNSEKDAFIRNKPYESWLFDENTCQWYPPVEKPNDNNDYLWDEDNQQWIEY